MFCFINVTRPPGLLAKLSFASCSETWSIIISILASFRHEPRFKSLQCSPQGKAFECTRPPGFEPGNPSGNRFSRPAQYQVVPRPHCRTISSSLWVFLKLTKNYIFFNNGLSTNGEIRVETIAMKMSEENTVVEMTPAVNASCAMTSSVSPLAFMAQPTIQPSFQLW